MRELKIEKKEVEVEKLVALVCDVCDKRYTNHLDIQEFLYINEFGGYTSVFGDGSSIRCEICQHYFKNLLGEYLRIGPDSLSF